MTTRKRRKTVYYSVDGEGNLYWKDLQKQKHVVPGDESLYDLELMQITFDSSEYKKEITERYLFEFVDAAEDTIILGLNRFSHLGHIFCNKLLNTDVSRKIDIGFYGKKEDDTWRRYSVMEQDRRVIKVKYQLSEFPGIIDGSNVKRSQFFEEKIKEVIEKLSDVSVPVVKDSAGVLEDTGTISAASLNDKDEVPWD